MAKVCQEMSEPFSEICDNFSTIYCTDTIQILSERYRVSKKAKCLVNHETIATSSIFKISFISCCQHPDLDFDLKDISFWFTIC